ncbi:hypothetical protein OPIT5_23785 [Opitutaceae bacterium TAV5]|nr:hypothetical protein OPIT5_23785 [Opitutaceae bacterium TAV5]
MVVLMVDDETGFAHHGTDPSDAMVTVIRILLKSVADKKPF